MNYKVVYQDGSLSCSLPDKDTALAFADLIAKTFGWKPVALVHPKPQVTLVRYDSVLKATLCENVSTLKNKLPCPSTYLEISRRS